MKILHLSSEPSWRGGEQQIAYLMEELNGLGVENIIACRKHSAFEDYSHQQRWTSYSLPFTGSIDFSTIRSIKSISRQEGVNLIHMHSAKSHSLAVLAHVLGNPTPLLLSRRVDFPIRSNRFTQWKYNHPAIKKILCVSHAIEQIVRASIKNPDRCLTIYDGINIHRFSQPTNYLRQTYQVPEDTLIIGNTSALAAHKDYFTFINTAQVFQQYHIPARFFIMGEGPQREEIKNYITQKNLQDTITMTGFLNHLPEVLPELDIFLMTSVTEGLGSSVLDAFACRIPVVATRAGGIPEMVLHQQTGLLANTQDAPTLAQHLYTIAADISLKNNLTANAYERLLSHFTKEKMAAATLKVYQEVC